MADSTGLPSRHLSPDYETYLQSPEWAATRLRAFRQAKRKCAGCGKRAEQVHHRSYERLGHEDDRDLVAVCDGCHVAIHAFYDRNGADISRWAATNIVLRERRLANGLPELRLPIDPGSIAQARLVVADVNRRRRDARRPGRGSPKEPKADSPERLEVRSVWCPRCKAKAGELCRDEFGVARRPNHQQRVVLYRQRQEAAASA